MSEDVDAARVRECLAGDPQAFAALVEQYEKPVYNVALRMLRNSEDARDIAQSVFMKAYQNLSSYDPQYKFYSWIYRMAINESLNILRVRGRSAGPVDERIPEEGAGPSELLADEQRRDVVLEAVDRLKPEHRAVIVLRYFVDRNYEDMGEILGIDAKTVKSRLYTARQLLKDQLSSQRGVVTSDKHPLQDLIQGDLDGELTAAERAELARLLLQDPEARRLQDDFRETDQLLRDIADAEPPAGLREAILAGHAGAGAQANPGHRQFGWPAYRIAAVILGGLLIVGLGILARDGDVTGKNLQGSLVRLPGA